MVSLLSLDAVQGEAGIPGTNGGGGAWVLEAQESGFAFSLSWFTGTKSSVLALEGTVKVPSAQRLCLCRPRWV